MLGRHAVPGQHLECIEELGWAGLHGAGLGFCSRTCVAPEDGTVVHVDHGSWHVGRIPGSRWMGQDSA